MKVRNKFDGVDGVWIVILAVGGALRLYRLDAQSQWVDEILSTLNASFSWRYIFELCWNVEVHPPGFYLFKHLMLALGGGDFWLRLPSALAGIACLHAAYLLGGAVGQSPAFARLIMALVAVNPLHVWISRQARPYTILVLVATLILVGLIRAARKGGRLPWAWAAVGNTVFSLFHYSGVLFFVSQLACLAGLKVLRAPRIGWDDIGRYAVWSLPGAAICLVFLFHARVVRTDGWITNTYDVASAARAVLDNLGRAAAFGLPDSPWSWGVPALLVAVAVGRAVLDRDRVGWVLASMLLTTPVLLLLGGYAAHFTPTHLTFLLPQYLCLAGASLFAGMRVCRIERLAWVVPAFPLAVFLWGHSEIFYSPERNLADMYRPQENYAVVAAFLKAIEPGGWAAAFDNTLNGAATQWYLDRGGEGRGPADVANGPPGTVTFLFFARDEDWRPTACCAVHKKTGLALPGLVQSRVGNLTLYIEQVRRPLGIVLSEAEPRFEVSAMPEDILARSLEISGLAFVVAEDWVALAPARAGVPGVCTFRVELPEADGARTLAVALDAFVLRPDNELSLWVRFDEGAWSRAAVRTEVDAGELRVAVPVPGQARRAEVQVRMLFSGDHAYVMNAPNDQVRFNKLAISMEKSN